MLQIENFQLPEEKYYRQRIESHPAIKKLEELFPDIWGKRGGSSILTQWRREGVRITRASRPDVIDAIVDTLNMFGSGNIKFEVFAGRSGESFFENAEVILEGNQVVFIFLNEILAKLKANELRSVTGHEVGHFLLGHTQATIHAAVLQIARYCDSGQLDPKTMEVVNADEDIQVLLDLSYILSQVQELSADRIGLLISRDFESAVIGEMKLAAGQIGDKYSIADYLEQADPVTDEDDWVIRTHPCGPQRCKALKLFYESDLYRQAIGAKGGESISSFSKTLSQLIPLLGLNDYRAASKIISIDDYVLELILMDLVAYADNKMSKKEQQIIGRYIPASCREEVFDQYRNVIAKTEKEPAVIGSYFLLASQRDSRWKTKMIKRFIAIARADRKIKQEELDLITDLAERIDAKGQCAKQFRIEFGFDPFE